MYGYIGGYYTFEYNDLGLRTAKKDYRGIGSKYCYDGDMLITEINPDYRLDFLYDESGMLYVFIYNKETKYFYIAERILITIWKYRNVWKWLYHNF